MGHSHSASTPSQVRIAATPRKVLMGLLAVAAVLTGVGLVLLWPDYSRVSHISTTFQSQYAAPGVTFPKGEIVTIIEGCPGEVQYGGGREDEIENVCYTANVMILTGDKTGQMTQVRLYHRDIAAGVAPGDELLLMSAPPTDTTTGVADQTPEMQSPDMQPTEYIFGVMRNGQLAMLLAAFVLVVVSVARLRGLLALVALAVSGLVLIGFLLPALISGGPGLPIALVGSATIMFVVLYVAHGISVRSSVALAGTLCGIAVTAAVAQFSVGFTRLSGITDESDAHLATMARGLDFRGLVTCGIIIAGLGVLNDVTITQASSMWELRAVAPDMNRRQLFSRGMRIGRDHIASTIYTIVFAYAGAALSVLLLLYLYNRPALELLSQDDLATEAVRTLCSAIGLILAVPITTGIAAIMLPPDRGRGRGPNSGTKKKRTLPSQKTSSKDEARPGSV